MTQLDWDDVRFFLAAARDGSLVGAARSLAVKHTTVGRRLDAFETTLGAKLFRRTSDGLQLTDVGERVQRFAEDMERAALQLAETAVGDGRIAGVVRLSISEGFSGVIVKPLGELRETHPDLVVDVLMSNASADLARGEADIAIRMGPLESSTVVCSKLGTFGWSLYADATYAARVDVARVPRSDWAIIGFDAALAHAPGARWIEANVAAERVVLRCNSLVAAMNAAIAGIGVAALPCILGASEPRLVRVSSDVIGTRDAYLLVHPDRQHVARVRAVLDVVRRTFAANAAIMSG